MDNLQSQTKPGNSLSDICPVCGYDRAPKTYDMVLRKITVPSACLCERREFERFIKERQTKPHGPKPCVDRIKTLDSFNVRDASTDKALWAARKFIGTYQQNKEGTGFWLIGEPGNGKTHLMEGVANALIDLGETVIFRPMGDVIARVKAAYDKSGTETESDIIRELKTVGTLILDDVGAHHNTKWTEAFFTPIFDYRYRNKLKTLGTSNCSSVNSDKSLVDALGERAWDRINERNAIIEIKADSYREEIKRQRMREKAHG